MNLPSDVEYHRRRADGVYRWHPVRGRPIRNAAGHIETWVGSCMDSEASKRHGTLLIDQATVLRLIMTDAPLPP
ncbi:MAG: hypothetical protein H7338_03175 [Candidatus Sericytochromatia bacterium]|nr:hypothetical protein [Candidatus Sericytochromatia bacterium]